MYDRKKYLTERAKWWPDKWWPVSQELMDSYRDGSHTKEWPDGTLEWYKNDQLHRDGDLPARILADGTLEWYKNGQPHRDDDKPASVWYDGPLMWFKNGQKHRNGDKPARILNGGTLEWYCNNKLHRVSGPAVFDANGSTEYWVNGVEITNEVKSWLKTRKYKHPFTPEQQVEFTLTFS